MGTLNSDILVNALAHPRDRDLDWLAGYIWLLRHRDDLTADLSWAYGRYYERGEEPDANRVIEDVGRDLAWLQGWVSRDDSDHMLISFGDWTLHVPLDEHHIVEIGMVVRRLGALPRMLRKIGFRDTRLVELP